MGLFNRKKSDQAGLGSGFGNSDLNNQSLGNQSMGGLPGQNQNLFKDPFQLGGNQDLNSGLRMPEVNSQSSSFEGGFEQPSPGFDSFGNPKIQPKAEGFSQGSFNQSQNLAPTQDLSKDIQLILSKLDTIRSELTNLNHRLDNLERQQQEGQQKKYPW